MLGFTSPKPEDIVLAFGSWDEKGDVAGRQMQPVPADRKSDYPIPALNVISCHGVWICQAV